MKKKSILISDVPYNLTLEEWIKFFTQHLPKKRNKMIKHKIMSVTGFESPELPQGESLEEKLGRIIASKEPIKDGAPILYTERKEGIRASTNIRTDRFEIAIDGTDKIAKSYKARRDERMKIVHNENDGGAESIQGTDGK